MWNGKLTLLSGMLVLVLSSLLVGCAALNPRPPVEALADTLVDDAIVPAVRDGLAQGVQQLVLQAGAQGINPTYVVEFEAKWITGVEGRASIGVEGVSGQLHMSTVANDETDRSPYQRDQTPTELQREAVTEPPTAVPGAP